jgi:hypothetical protein
MILEHPVWAAIILLWVAALILLALATFPSKTTTHRQRFRFRRRGERPVLGRLSPIKSVPHEFNPHRYEDQSLSLFARN